MDLRRRRHRRAGMRGLWRRALADLAYAPHLKLVAEGGYDFAPTPLVRAWLERLWARPAWQRAEQLVFADDA